MQRRGFKHLLGFPDRLVQEARRRLRDEAEKVSGRNPAVAAGPETAAQINEWIYPPGLLAPQ